MANQRISAGQIASAPGPFYKVGAVPAGDAISHPGRVFTGPGYLFNQGLPGQEAGGSWLQTQGAGANKLGYMETQAQMVIIAESSIGLTVASRSGNDLKIV